MAFNMLGSLGPGGLLHIPVKADVKIIEGYTVMFNAGYADNCGEGELLTATFAGIAVFTADNTAAGAADGDIFIDVVPWRGHRFIVPGKTSSLQEKCGAIVDMNHASMASSIDETDTSADGEIGFFIEEIKSPEGDTTDKFYAGHFEAKNE